MDRQLQVKPTKTADLADIHAIECLCFSDPWTQEMLFDVLKNPHSNCFTAVLDGKIIGFCMMWNFEAIGEGQIGNIAVNPDFRGFGAGDILVCAMLDIARQKGIAEIFLEVRQGNVAAQRLYEKHGFEAFGIRKNYYTKPIEDAVLMKINSNRR